MPLPQGWTATVSRFELDDDHVPNRWRVGLQLMGPNGVGFPVEGSIPAPEVDGATPRQIVAAVWPRMRPYVMSTLQDLITNQPPPAPPAILGQNVVLS